MNWIKKTNNKLKQGIVAYYPLLLIAFVWLMLQLLMQAWTGDEFLYADLLKARTEREQGVEYLSSDSVLRSIDSAIEKGSANG